MQLTWLKQERIEVPEETMLEAIMFGHDEIKRLIAFQEEIVQAVGKEKIEVKLYEVDADLNQAVREMAEDRYAFCNSSARKTCT